MTSCRQMATPGKESWFCIETNHVRGYIGMSYTIGKLRKRVDCLAHWCGHQKQLIWIKSKEKNVSIKMVKFPIISLPLRIPDSYHAKKAKIGNFWTFSPVIQLIYHLFKIQKRAFLPKWLFVGFWKDGLLAKLQTNTSRSCIVSLFLPHKYQVSLSQ